MGTQSPVAGRIGSTKDLAVIGEEHLVLVFGQALEYRPQGRAFHPLENCILALEDVEVGRLPRRNDLETSAAELVDVPPWLANVGCGQPVEPFAPPRARAQLMEESVRRLLVVGGNLERENADSGQLWQQVVEEGPVVFDPVEAGVRDHQIDRFGRLPAADFGYLEAEATRDLSRPGAVDHLFRIVDAGDVRRRPLFEQRCGENAGTAAEIDHGGRNNLANRRHQMLEGQSPLLRETEIPIGIPGHRSEYGTS